MVSKYGVFSGPYFPVFGLNTEKYGPEKTPYLSTFQVVPWTTTNLHLIHLFLVGLDYIEKYFSGDFSLFLRRFLCGYSCLYHQYNWAKCTWQILLDTQYWTGTIFKWKIFKYFMTGFFFVNYFLSFFAQMKTKIYLGQTK